MLLPSFVKASYAAGFSSSSENLQPLQQQSPRLRGHRHRRSASSSRRRNIFVAFVLMLGATPQQTHAQSSSTCGCQFNHACFPANGLLLKQAVNDFTANPSTWTGMIGSDDYGSLPSEWCTGLVTNMHQLFRDKGGFNEDISAWNTASVTDMSFMFYHASTFVGDGIGSWNVSKVTNMDRMFYFAGSFTGDISSWDVSSVSDMRWMFRSAHSFNGSIGSWDVSKVTSIRGMFGVATLFNGNIGAWNVSSVTDVVYTFSQATSFNQPLSSWDVSSITTMRGMFINAGNFSGSSIGG